MKTDYEAWGSTQERLDKAELRLRQAVGLFILFSFGLLAWLGVEVEARREEASKLNYALARLEYEYKRDTESIFRELTGYKVVSGFQMVTEDGAVYHMVGVRVNGEP